MSMNKRTPIAVYASSGFAFVLFLIIVAYHMSKQKYFATSLAYFKQKLCRKFFQTNKENMNTNQELLLEKAENEVTTTVIDMS